MTEWLLLGVLSGWSAGREKAGTAAAGGTAAADGGVWSR